MEGQEQTPSAYMFRSDTGFILYKTLTTFGGAIFVVIFFTTWFLGVHWSKGFWETTKALFPPYAWYVVTIEIGDDIFAKHKLTCEPEQKNEKSFFNPSP